MGSAYQRLAWWLQRLLIMMSCPPMRAGSEGAGFGDGGLEDEGAGREEFADGGCDGLAFTFGLSRILEAKVVHAGGCKEVGDVCDAVAEGASYIECACIEVRWEVTGH